jgi:putative ABC transport system permease protein
MLRNYLLIAFRNINKFKGYSFINIAGLACGMAFFILISLWVRDELNFDRFHEHADDIYRLISEVQVGDEITLSARTPNPLGPALAAEYPEVINFTRTQGVENWFVQCGEKQFLNDTVACADPSFFEMFTFPFVKGNPKTALKDRYSIVITESMARKYFGNEDPMGKVIKVHYVEYKVTGVLKDIPRNSHIMFDCIFPIINMTRYWSVDFNDWKRYLRFYTYVQLRQNTSREEFAKRILTISQKHAPELNIKVYLQPLADIHLRSSLKWDLDNYNQGNINYVYIFSLVAFFFLLVACINFMNLSTARSTNRSKEIGIRKVVGANRKILIQQFLIESIILSIIAFIFAIIMVHLLLPTVNALSDKQLSLGEIFTKNLQILLGFLGLIFFTGIFSGLYPAFFLSAIQPARVLNKIDRAGKPRGAYLRKVLAAAQFTIVVAMIFGTAVVSRQLHFFRTKDLGFNKENVIYIPVNYRFRTDDQAVKNEFLENPGVLSITASVPPTKLRGAYENVNWQGKEPNQVVAIHPVSIDYDYLKTFDMSMLKGRFFSRDYPSDTSNYILNEAAVKATGIKSPLGKRFWLEGQEGIIIGVMKDFHHASLHAPVDPVVFKLFYEPTVRWMSIKIRASNFPETLKFLETKYRKFVPDYPFFYIFLDETIAEFYKTEQKVGTAAYFCTFLIIFISCIGLLGLSSYMIEKRTKEIGVRKVLGASVFNIFRLLSQEFLKVIVIAIIIAGPITLYITKAWLQNFYYRINIHWWDFLGAGVLALIITLLTIGFQCTKAAFTSPVVSLKYE